jgi:hypothetical protein
LEEGFELVLGPVDIATSDETLAEAVRERQKVDERIETSPATAQIRSRGQLVVLARRHGSSRPDGLPRKRYRRSRHVVEW